MLYTPSWHVGKTQHVRINADTLTSFYQTQWKRAELPLLCSSDRSLSPLASCWLFNRTSRSPLSERQPPPHIFLKVSTSSKQETQSHKSLENILNIYTYLMLQQHLEINWSRIHFRLEITSFKCLGYDLKAAFWHELCRTRNGFLGCGLITCLKSKLCMMWQKTECDIPGYSFQFYIIMTFALRLTSPF